MKFIAGNKEFANNAKQLIPDTTIFDKMILKLPEGTYKGILGDHNVELDGKISSEKGINTIYRSAYYLYLHNHEKITDNVFTLDVRNKTNNVSLNTPLNTLFNTWAIVQVSENTYLFFIGIDLEQSFKLEGTNKDVNDGFLQVVI